MQRTSRCLPSSTAEVRKMRSPHTTGEDCPRPLMGVFHVSEPASHLVGTLASLLIPLPSEPRKRDQLSTSAPFATTHPVNALKTIKHFHDFICKFSQANLRHLNWIIFSITSLCRNAPKAPSAPFHYLKQ